MRWLSIQRLMGLLTLLFAFTNLPPLLVSLVTADGQYMTFIETTAVTLVLGAMLWFPARNVRTELRTRDGFLVVALFWSVLGVLGGVPFILGPHLEFTDAVFEAVSGFTTTGATVIVGLDAMPPSILYHRQQLQWLGGLGVIVLAVAIIPMLGVGGMQLYRAEVPGPIKDDKLTPRIMHTARTLWYIYLALTAACALAYWLSGMSLFDAVGHAYSTIATGGFSTHDASIGYFDSVAVESVANVFMLLGGINFAVHFIVWRRRDPRIWWRDTETRIFVLLVAAATALIAFVLVTEQVGRTPGEAVRGALFHVVSVITTTGYGTENWSAWPVFVPLMLAAISYVGGCAGSTAGGMKVVRIILMFKQGLRETFRLVHPRAMTPLKVGPRAVDDRVMDSVWGFYSLYILSSLLLTGLMMWAGLDLESAFGAVIATINLLGPGLGEVATTFSTVPDTVKWLGIVAMLLGRLEVFTLFVLVTPSFWRN